MRLEPRVSSDLNSLIGAIAPVEGVLAVILFGSYARGEYDESSDYDLLAVFRDSETMWKHRKEIFTKVGRLGLFVQILTRTRDELANETEPTFLASIMRDGQILYSRFPFTFRAAETLPQEMSLITYTLKGLTHREKLRLAYRLFGKIRKEEEASGLLGSAGGRHLSPGCIIVPTDEAKKIIQVFEEAGVRIQKLPILSVEPKDLIPLHPFPKTPQQALQ